MATAVSTVQWKADAKRIAKNPQHNRTAPPPASSSCSSSSSHKFHLIHKNPRKNLEKESIFGFESVTQMVAEQLNHGGGIPAAEAMVVVAEEEEEEWQDRNSGQTTRKHRKESSHPPKESQRAESRRSSRVGVGRLQRGGGRGGGGGGGGGGMTGMQQATIVCHVIVEVHVNDIVERSEWMTHWHLY